MCTSLKKLLLVVFTLFLGLTSSGAMAAPYNATVNGTNYNFTYFTGSYNNNTSKFSNDLMPWWSNPSLALTFATALGAGLEYPNSNNTIGPYFSYSSNNNVYGYRINNTFVNTAISKNTSYTYAIATPAVPEIDGAQIPQVGFLIACLFLILGRRKENTESMLAA